MTTTQTPLPETAPAAPTAPRLDLRAVVDSIKLPGIDTQKLVELYRKDIEAVLAANERAFLAFEALTRKQVDVLVSLAKEWQATAKDAVASTGATEKLSGAGARAQQGFSFALASMKEMAEIVAKSGQDVATILGTRFRDRMDDLRKIVRAKS